MSQFSRVKKNKELYHDIIQDENTEIIETSLKDYERRVSKSEEDTYVASRLKRNQNVLEDTASVKKVKHEEDSSINKEELLSDRDLLADFIEEVKHYNINRGLRSVQDTQMNILQNLNSDQEQGSTSTTLDTDAYIKKKESVYDELSEEKENLETVELDTVSELTQEIQAIILDLDEDLSVVSDIEDEVEEDVFKFQGLDQEKDEELASVFNEIETSALNLSDLIQTEDGDIQIEETKMDNHIESIFDKPLISETVEVRNDNTLKDEPISSSDFKSNELLELTQTLSLKLDLHEQEDIYAPEKTKQKGSVLDKVLTGIIIILAIALICIIIMGIIWVAKGRGM